MDAALTLAVLAGSLALLLHGGVAGSAHSSQLDLLGGALAVCAALPLVAWRRRPLEVFLLAAGASTVAATLGYSVGIPLAPTAGLYLLAATRDRAGGAITHLRTVVLALLGAYLAATGLAQHTFPASELLHTGLAWALAWFAGERTRLVHQHMRDLAERAQRNQRDAERERQLAAVEERARIARDLHDSAGHAISVIAVRAGAVRLRHAEDPERSRQALHDIEELARQTADDIDQIVATLRDRGTHNGSGITPLGLTALGTLVAQHEAAGLAVTVQVTGDRRTLSAPIDQAAYRVLQEALTNAARHGSGSVRVELTFDETALAMAVSNPVSSDAEAQANGGHGLVGMRERALLVGGELEAVRINGNFQLHARLPYESAGA